MAKQLFNLKTKRTYDERSCFKELDGGFKVEEPVAVIIDGNSASASEILLRLHESANVPLIGTKHLAKERSKR